MGLTQWFLNFSGARTNKNILVIREAQNIDLSWDSRTTGGPRSRLWESLVSYKGNMAIEVET